jgi:hypothetical protein
MPRGRLIVSLAIAVLTVVTLAAIAIGGGGHDGHSPRSAPDPSAQPSATQSARKPSSVPRATGGRTTTDPELREDLASMADTPRYPTRKATRIGGDTARQPDLYAGEFVRRLLTRNYGGQSRNVQLAWVQAESATTTEPLVIGLVPPNLQDRFAVWSVTDVSDGPAPVPPAPEWARLAAGHTVDKAVVQRVMEPAAWSGAVQAGRITDPGVTGREVLATVTRSSGRGTQNFSVAVSLNLEGPPVRSTWGVVAVITFTSIPVSAS